MRIYTKTGDTGTSSLFSGKKVSKSHPRLNAYGTFDELNAHIGVFLSNLQATDLPRAQSDLVLQQVVPMQSWLFTMGSHLACDSEKTREKLQAVDAQWITNLEEWIDELEKDLPPLKSFILPGGGLAGSQLHVCRTVCRRAERYVVELINQSDDIQPEILKCVNRMSDYFFVLSRWINKMTGHEETLWES